MRDDRIHSGPITQRTLRAAIVAFLLCSGIGCATIRVTNPPRTATEQFLMSQATARAVDQLSVNAMRDRSVFIDPTYLAPSGAQMSQEQTFAIGELRAKLLLAGARIANTRDTAQITVEIRSEGIGTDLTDFLLGIPAIYFPGASSATGNVPLAIPELAIIKRTKQRGFAGFAYVAYWNDTGEIVANSGPYVGRTARDDFWFFGYHTTPVGDIAPAQDRAAPSTRPSTQPASAP